MGMAKDNVPDLAVDLGLSVLWSNKNIGNFVEGEHYSWGIRHEWFCESSYYSILENPPSNICANPEFDIARYEYGKSWRLPTVSEFKELILCCKWIWVNMNNSSMHIAGYKVFGPNGNHIFLPAAGQGEGFVREETFVDHYDVYGFYWTGMLCDDKDMAYMLFFSEGGIGINKGWRSKGNSVRPVCTR